MVLIIGNETTNPAHGPTALARTSNNEVRGFTNIVFDLSAMDDDLSEFLYS